MAKRVLATIICWMVMCGVSWAQSWEIDLSAGAESATGGVHYRQFVDTGFIKVGGTGIYHIDKDISFRIATVDFFAGSDTLSPGLTIEVGLRGIFGSAENDDESGYFGSVGFAGNAEYVFSPQFFPIPLEAFGMLTYAPGALSFQDSQSYWEFTAGTGVRIGRYASIRLSYSAYNTEMESGSDRWSATSGCLRLGIVLRF